MSFATQDVLLLGPISILIYIKIEASVFPHFKTRVLKNVASIVLFGNGNESQMFWCFSKKNANRVKMIRWKCRVKTIDSNQSCWICVRKTCFQWELLIHRKSIYAYIFNNVAHPFPALKGFICHIPYGSFTVWKMFIYIEESEKLYLSDAQKNLVSRGR